MKTHKLVKGNVTVFFRIGKIEAEMRRQVGQDTDTHRTALTPLEANRKMNTLLRQGYAAQNSTQKQA
jgi:hypothetical protein